MQSMVTVHVRRVGALVLIAGVALTLSPNAGVVSASSPRSGILHVQKDCSDYTGLAGSFCTIKASNLEALRVGSNIVYLQASAADGSIDSDVVIYAGPGSTIFGHCTVSAINTGGCTLAGGTGQFTHFHALESVALVPPDVAGNLYGNLYSWDGPYSFSPSEDDM